MDGHLIDLITASPFSSSSSSSSLPSLPSSRVREDLRAAHHRINTMLADYGDVVPRREFEMLESSYKARMASLTSAVSLPPLDIKMILVEDIFLLSQTMESELETLKSDHTTLVEEHR